MSKDSKKSYEEIHKRLGKEMEKAYLERERPGEKVPEFDLSFLDEDPDAPTEENDAAREEVFAPAKKEKKRRFSRFTKVAAVVIIFLLCTNIFLLGRNSSESYGDKGILHRLYQGVTGLFTDSEEQTEDSDVEEAVTVLDEKDIDSAKEFLPGLYVPTYMPEGYKLKKLALEKFYSGDYQAIYLYESGEKKLKILQYYTSNADISYQLPEDSTLVELADRKLVVFKDEIENQDWVTVYTESCSMDIMGEETSGELLKVGENLKK